MKVSKRVKKAAPGPAVIDHWTCWRNPDDVVMLKMAIDILAHPEKPRWLLSCQYQWLLQNEGERYGWFSKWVHAADRSYRHFWRKAESSPEHSYLITPQPQETA